MLFSATAAGPILVEPTGVETLIAYRDAWLDLTRRQLEPNVFSEPDFCLPAWRHGLATDGLIVVLLWAVEAKGSRRLVGVAPLRGPHFPLRPLVESWSHDLTAQGGPVLDRELAVPALEALLAWMAWRHPGAVGWLVPALPAEGATARALETALGPRAPQRHRLESRVRAVLSQGEPAGLAAVSRKKAKDLKRQKRRLAERGGLDFFSAVTPQDLGVATERFLALEMAGWKGRRGTAMLARPAQAAFLRDMVERMGAGGRCRVDSLTLDGRPVAMGIVLTSGRRDYFWKVAYDEAHAGASPGVQLTLALTRRQQAGGVAEMTDSCAQAHHPMIDHLWRGRLEFADLLIPLPGRRRRRFAVLAAMEEVRRAARSRLEQLARALRHR